MGEAEMIAVDKIGVGAGLDPGEQRMGSPLGELVPSHMRDLERWVGGFDRNHLAADPTEALGGLELPAAIRHQLHADADPEKWAAAGEHGLLEGIFEPGHRGEPAPAIGKRTHPRKDDAIGAGHGLGLAGHLDLGRNPVFGGGALKRLGRRAQIARAVIDDRDDH